MRIILTLLPLLTAVTAMQSLRKLSALQKLKNLRFDFSKVNSVKTTPTQPSTSFAGTRDPISKRLEMATKVQRISAKRTFKDASRVSFGSNGYAPTTPPSSPPTPAVVRLRPPLRAKLPVQPAPVKPIPQAPKSDHEIREVIQKSKPPKGILKRSSGVVREDRKVGFGEIKTFVHKSNRRIDRNPWKEFKAAIGFKSDSGLWHKNSYRFDKISEEKFLHECFVKYCSKKNQNRDYDERVAYLKDNYEEWVADWK